MKFLTILESPVDKMPEISKISDKINTNPPPGYKLLASYICLSAPFDGASGDTIISIAINEAENAEALATVTYPLVLAGVKVRRVPILEISGGAAGEAERKYRG